MRFERITLYILVFACIWGMSTHASQSYAQSTGLRFFGQEHNINERTSLELFPQKPLHTSNHFSIEFELSFEKNYGSYFGYIFRMINEEGTNIDLIFENKYDTIRTINLIIGENQLLLSVPIQGDNLFKWQAVKLDFDILNEVYTLYFGDQQISQKGNFLPLKNSLEIYFGVNHKRGIETIDLPNMKIRHIKINNNHKLVHHWPLNNLTGSSSEDIISQQEAHLVNPFWLYQNHLVWRLVHDLEIKNTAEITFSPQENRFFILSSDSLISFYAGTNDAYTRTGFRSPINLIRGNNFLYDNIHRHLLRYSVDQKLLSTYDFEQNSWSKKFPRMPGFTSYWQHNKFISPQDTSLRIIGGYGQLAFKNTYHTVDFSSEKWEAKEPDRNVFGPRYLAGLGANSSGDTLYILGGYGSLLGEQKINPKYWYELIRHIPSTGEMERLFSYDDLEINGFCFANSIIVQGDEFYALAFSKFEYDNHLQLYKGSLKSSYFEPYGEKIPFTFNDVRTFVDLFYAPQEEEIFATLSYLNDKNESEIKVYALNFPPEKIGTPHVESDENNSFIYLIIGGLLVLSLAILILFVRRNMKRVPSEPLESDTESPKIIPIVKEEDISNMVVKAEESIQQPPKIVDLPKLPPDKNNQILLFGGFQIIDEEGADITSKFTPLLRELFLLLYLNSFGDRRGISSENLRKMLWSDKTDKDARNNRAVNMSRLKGLLSKVGKSTISKETGYWKVNIDYAKVYVDYEFLHQVETASSPGQAQIMRLIKTTRNRPFLKNIQREWLDPFKATVSNNTVDTLINWATMHKDDSDPLSIIALTDAIFEFDPINEEAMALKCKALVDLGKHGLAKNTYDAFAKEYEILYGEPYQHSFTEVIE